MFTGIIEEIGFVKSIQNAIHSAILRIEAVQILSDVHIGDSIAVNGVCLTVTHFTAGYFEADVMHETLCRTALGGLKAGSPVNLERAMPINGRFGGHIVAGHIDGTAVIHQIRQDDNAIRYTINAKESLLRYVVEKGSIAIDGISLTVVSVTNHSFTISIIPHTAKQTILSIKKVGDMVNIENDVAGKYIEKFMGISSQTVSKKGITKELLTQYGF